MSRRLLFYSDPSEGDSDPFLWNDYYQDADSPSDGPSQSSSDEGAFGGDPWHGFHDYDPYPCYGYTMFTYRDDCRDDPREGPHGGWWSDPPDDDYWAPPVPLIAPAPPYQPLAPPLQPVTAATAPESAQQGCPDAAAQAVAAPSPVAANQKGGAKPGNILLTVVGCCLFAVMTALLLAVCTLAFWRCHRRRRQARALSGNAGPTTRDPNRLADASQPANPPTDRTDRFRRTAEYTHPLHQFLNHVDFLGVGDMLAPAGGGSSSMFDWNLDGKHVVIQMPDNNMALGTAMRTSDCSDSDGSEPPSLRMTPIPEASEITVPPLHPLVDHAWLRPASTQPPPEITSTPTASGTPAPVGAQDSSAAETSRPASEICRWYSTQRPYARPPQSPEGGTAVAGAVAVAAFAAPCTGPNAVDAVMPRDLVAPPLMPMYVTDFVALPDPVRDDEDPERWDGDGLEGRGVAADGSNNLLPHRFSCACKRYSFQASEQTDSSHETNTSGEASATSMSAQTENGEHSGPSGDPGGAAGRSQGGISSRFCCAGCSAVHSSRKAGPSARIERSYEHELQSSSVLRVGNTLNERVLLASPAAPAAAAAAAATASTQHVVTSSQDLPSENRYVPDVPLSQGDSQTARACGALHSTVAQSESDSTGSDSSASTSVCSSTCDSGEIGESAGNQSEGGPASVTPDTKAREHEARGNPNFPYDGTSADLSAVVFGLPPPASVHDTCDVASSSAQQQALSTEPANPTGSSHATSFYNAELVDEAPLPVRVDGHVRSAADQSPASSSSTSGVHVEPLSVEAAYHTGDHSASNENITSDQYSVY